MPICKNPPLTNLMGLPTSRTNILNAPPATISLWSRHAIPIGRNALLLKSVLWLDRHRYPSRPQFPNNAVEAVLCLSTENFLSIWLSNSCNITAAFVPPVLRLIVKGGLNTLLIYSVSDNDLTKSLSSPQQIKHHNPIEKLEICVKMSDWSGSLVADSYHAYTMLVGLFNTGLFNGEQ